jgi:hypothetical protein
VDLAWVTEDETALFDLPGYARQLLRDCAEKGGPPVTTLDTSESRVRLAGAVPSSYFGAGAAAVAAIPRDAHYVCANLRAADAQSLSRLSDLEVLDASDATERTLCILGTLPSLWMLTLGGVQARSLDALAPLVDLQIADIRGALQVRDVSALAAMPELRALVLDVRGMPDLPAISELTQLWSLCLTSDKAVDSLAPLAALRELRHLRLAVGAKDRSLLPLTSLQNLETLRLNKGSFPFAQFAELAVALPHTDGPHRSPFVTVDEWTMSPRRCKACDIPKDITLGKPRRELCRVCDRKLVERHVARWEILLSAVMARRSAVS